MLTSALLVLAAMAAHEKEKQYFKVEVRGTLRQQLIIGGDSFWRMQFTAKGGGSLRMSVEVGKDTMTLTLPNDGKMPAAAEKLVGKEVVILGKLERCPDGFYGVFLHHPPPFEYSHHIRVTSIKLADAK
jgi:hypothetical protein